MTSARIQPICRTNNINIGCFRGKKKFPGNITQRKTALFIHNNGFCLVWKSSFIQAIKEELKPNFKVFERVQSDKHVKSFIIYEHKPRKIQSP